MGYIAIVVVHRVRLLIQLDGLAVLIFLPISLV